MSSPSVGPPPTSPASRSPTAQQHCTAHYTPTLSELQSLSFTDFIRQKVFPGPTSPGGLAKITFPQGWSTLAGIGFDPSGRGPQWQPGTKLGNLPIPNPIMQCSSGVGGIYEFTMVVQKPTNVHSFRTFADEYKAKQLEQAVKRGLDVESEVTEEVADEMARVFWRNIGPTMQVRSTASGVPQVEQEAKRREKSTHPPIQKRSAEFASLMPPPSHRVRCAASHLRR